VTRSRLAAAITRAASKQTYYTIRLLVDRPRRDDAFRAYAYFRWLDDVLDDQTQWDASSAAARERQRFLARQMRLLEECLAGEELPITNAYESMLVELVRNARPSDLGLAAYLRNMMLVMEVDGRRRGRLVSAAELDQYTRCLATAVTEAMHHFIGHGAITPRDGTRYAAASGAHIVHMLRDTIEDVRAGYFNVPREVLETHSIGPGDVRSDGYRSWVSGRLALARTYFEAGRAYLACVPHARHRLAASAYIARFEWLIRQIERDRFVLRPRYAQRAIFGSALRTSGFDIAQVTGIGWNGTPSRRMAWPRWSRT
jgi:phytoene/squalene synthetase